MQLHSQTQTLENNWIRTSGKNINDFLLLLYPSAAGVPVCIIIVAGTIFSSIIPEPFSIALLSLESHNYADTTCDFTHLTSARQNCNNKCSDDISSENFSRACYLISEMSAREGEGGGLI